jgi:hypothetical protein
VFRYGFKRIKGWWRLKFGYCPLCDSSPPRKDCPICIGSYEYGQDANDAVRGLWRERYIHMLKEDALKS